MMPDQPTTPDTDSTENVAPQNSGQPTLALKVYAPFQVYFEGEARSVSAVNATGPFDILPKHHNFLCMLIPSELKIQQIDGAVKTIKIHRALMHVKSDRVVVFMDV
jgi:F0F1-type ATP synthase epsilon subunit